MDTEQDDGNESSDSDSEASVPEDGGDEEGKVLSFLHFNELGFICV